MYVAKIIEKKCSQKKNTVKNSSRTTGQYTTLPYKSVALTTTPHKTMDLTGDTSCSVYNHKGVGLRKKNVSVKFNQCIL
jgi:hypothetical protein